MSVEKASEAVKTYFKKVMGKTGATIGVEKLKEGWKILFEAVDDQGAGFDPIYGLYEVYTDDELNVTKYNRTKLRRRSELEWHAPLE